MAPRRPARATKKPKADTITEEDVNAAVSVIQRDYYNDVRGIVEAAEEAVKDGEISSQEQLDEWLNQTCDGAGRVIYTYQAKLGLLVSDHADAGLEEGLVNLEGDVIPYSQLMYHALFADVNERLPSFDFDD